MDETKAAAAGDHSSKVRSGSANADSGQSSSADTSSSSGSSSSAGSTRSDSIADSLEDQPRAKLTAGAAAAAAREANESAETVKNYLSDVKGQQQQAPPASNDVSARPATPKNPQDTSDEQPAMKQPLRSALASSNVKNNNIHNNNNNASANNLNKLGTQAALETEQTQQKNSNYATNNNNNFSGLNLNMTASEMRELLARRKKFDPKKAQMNIRQKYEIIQQM